MMEQILAARLLMAHGCHNSMLPAACSQFVEKENTSLAGELEGLDGTLSEKRDLLGKAKATRDTLRQNGRRIKESSVFITNPALLDDIEVRLGELAVLVQGMTPGYSHPGLQSVGHSCSIS